MGKSTMGPVPYTAGVAVMLAPPLAISIITILIIVVVVLLVLGIMGRGRF
jgi:hypothetical protein